MPPNICLFPAYHQVQEIRSGPIISRELLKRYIARIDAIDEKVNAVVTRDFEHARRTADAADATAAVAAGLTSFDIGTDVGGLIRLPASICGGFTPLPI